MTTVNKHIYITGTGRCGTNLMKRIFQQRSDVSSLNFEPRYMIDPDGIISFLSMYRHNWSPFNVDAAFKRLKHILTDLQSGKTTQYPKWEIDKSVPNFQAHVDKLLDRLDIITFEGSWCRDNHKHKMFFPRSNYDHVKKCMQDFCRSVVCEIMSPGADIFVDDSTWSCLHANDILEIFPEAFFIYIKRNPLDIIRSFTEQRWVPSCVQECYSCYQQLTDQWNEQKCKIGSSHFIEVHFEDMIDNPDTVFKDIYSKTGILLHDDKNIISKSKTNDGSWRSKFTQDEIDFIKYNSY